MAKSIKPAAAKAEAKKPLNTKKDITPAAAKSKSSIAKSAPVKKAAPVSAGKGGGAKAAAATEAEKKKNVPATAKASKTKKDAPLSPFAANQKTGSSHTRLTAEGERPV